MDPKLTKLKSHGNFNGLNGLNDDKPIESTDSNPARHVRGMPLGGQKKMTPAVKWMVQFQEVTIGPIVWWILLTYFVRNQMKSPTRFGPVR